MIPMFSGAFSTDRSQDTQEDASLRSLYIAGTPAITPDSPIPSGCRPGRIAATRSGDSKVGRSTRPT